MKIEAGKPAPDFTLPDQDGKEHSLSSYRGNWVLLYFYPEDDTPGCTEEACLIRDTFPSFGKLKAIVLGVSVDSVASHKKFADKYKLPFTLLADIEKKAVNLYGVWQVKKLRRSEGSESRPQSASGYMGTARTSFLIDPEGEIVKVYEKVKPETHAAEVLEDLKNLAK